jgi:hypothetical protein
VVAEDEELEAPEEPAPVPAAPVEQGASR